MSAVRKFGFLALAAGVIGVGGYFALQPRTGSTDPTADLTAGGCYGKAVVERHYGFSEWALVANQMDNRVDWSPKAVTCDRTAGTADVIVQITHKKGQRETVQVDTGPTIITQDDLFTRERVTYRFDCKGKQIAALERRIMSDGDAVLRVIDLKTNGAPVFKPYGEGGVGSALDGPVCSTALRLR
jgi:hypothetical protein